MVHPAPVRDGRGKRPSPLCLAAWWTGHPGSHALKAQPSGRSGPSLSWDRPQRCPVPARYAPARWAQSIAPDSLMRAPPPQQAQRGTAAHPAPGTPRPQLTVELRCTSCTWYAPSSTPIHQPSSRGQPLPSVPLRPGPNTGQLAELAGGKILEHLVRPSSSRPARRTPGQLHIPIPFSAV